ncbi:MAG: hypothetical protein QXU98_14660, partial [Candidatus Parvarchaeota archaeon]
MARLYTYKITLSNTTSTATPAGLQVRLNINFSAIEGLNPNLSNIRFSSDPAGFNLLYAWLESAPQGTFTQGSSVSSYTSSNIWVNLGNNIIPANGSLNIYMQVFSSGTEFDGVYWGANPQWTNTYGQYDNGANVFSFYDNFAGTSLRSGWTNMGNATATTVNNGVTMVAGTGNSNQGYYFSGYQMPLGTVIDALYKDTGSGNARGSEIGIGTVIFTVSSERVLDFEVNPGSSDYWYMEGYVNGYATTPVYSSGTLIILSGAYYSTGATEYENYVPVLTLTGTATTSDTYPNFGVYQDSLFIQWLRVRLYPPNGTDPVLTSISILPSYVGNYVSVSIPFPEWNVLSGKPYITVSAKGISNGFSNIPNDGADFGPDTLLGASSPNQYGPPYTQTSGIQEAINYLYSISVPYSFPNTELVGPVLTNVTEDLKLLDGTFKILAPITIPYNLSLNILGSGQSNTVLDTTTLSGTVINWEKSPYTAPINGGNFYTWGNKIADFTVVTNNTSSTDYSVDFSQPEGAYRYSITNLQITDISNRYALSLRLDGLEGCHITLLSADTVSYLNPYGGVTLERCIIYNLNVAAVNAVYLNCTLTNYITIYGAGGGNRSVHSFVGGFIGSFNTSSKGNLIFNVTTSPTETIVNVYGAMWILLGGSTYPNRPLVTGTSNAPVYVNFDRCTFPNAGYPPWPVFDNTFAS